MKPRNDKIAICFALLASIFVSPLFAQTDSVWIGEIGVWADDFAWSPLGAPNNIGNDHHNAFIDNDAGTNSVVRIDPTPSLDDNLFTVDSLTIGSGDLVQVIGNIHDASILTVEFNSQNGDSGALVNGGEIQLIAENALSRLRLLDTTVSGGGTITLTGALGTADINGSASTSVVNVDNLIQGKGAITGINLTNTSAGTIVANDPSGSLFLQTVANSMWTNQGNIKASNGGQLILQRTFLNEGGQITAEDNSNITLQEATIIGGVVSSTGNGTLNNGSGISTLESVTLAGQFEFDSGILNLEGNITNLAEIVVENSGGQRELRMVDTVTLDGGGTISLKGSAETSQIIVTNNGNLINTDNLIQGKGLLRGVSFENRAGGTVDANDSTGSLTLLPNANQQFKNEGLMTATNGGNLVLSRTIDNERGMISSADGSNIVFSQASVTGGIVQSLNSGTFSSAISTAVLNETRIMPGGSAIGSLDLTGSFRFGPMSVVEIELESQNSFDAVHLNTTLTLQGDLSVTISGGFTPANSDTFTVVTAGNLVGGFSNVAAGDSISTSDGIGEFTVNYGPTSPFDPNHVVLSHFEPSGTILGDVNGDGLVNLLDVAPFIERIGSGDYQAEADVNQDGAVNLLDVAPFVSILSGG